MFSSKYSDLDWFRKHYRARIRPSHEKVVTPHYSPMNAFDANDANWCSHEVITREEECVEVTLPRKDFERVVDIVQDYHDVESRWRRYEFYEREVGPNWAEELVKTRIEVDRETIMRENNPSLRSAWEKYKVLLNLVK